MKILKKYRKQNLLYKSWVLFLCTLIIIGQLELVAPVFVKAETQGVGSSQNGIVSDFSSGNGTEQNPYIITTPEELNKVREHLDKHFKLGSNIELTNGWEPIGSIEILNAPESGAGDNTSNPPGELVIPTTPADPVVEVEETAFKGSFDGGNFKISGLEISSEESGVFGLFGLTDGATIKNLTLDGVSITAKETIAVGGLVGKARNTTIDEITVSGEISGSNSVAGLVGSADKVTLLNSNSSASVEGTEDVGGLIGYSENKTTIENSYTEEAELEDKEKSKVSGETKVGGLIGNANDTTVKLSISKIDTKGKDNVGGLIGVAENGTTINKAYATGNVEGTNNIGGLIGLAKGEKIEVQSGEEPDIKTEVTIIKTEINEAYAKGNVEGVSNLGGLIGFVEPHTEVKNTYASGSVTGIVSEGTGTNEEDASTPGAVGGLAGTFDQATIINSYAIGLVKGTEKHSVAGLIGVGISGEITSSFFENQENEQDELLSSIGTFERFIDDEGNEAYTVMNEVGGRSKEAMQNPLTFEGWDFDKDKIWVSNKEANGGYLFLRFQKEYKDFEHIAKTETPAEKVARAKENLMLQGDLENVASDLTLPTLQNGVTITWSSDKPSTIAIATTGDKGTVVRPAAGKSDEKVKLTATLKSGEATATKEFTLTVVKKPKRAEDVEIRINNRALIGNISNRNPDNAFLNINTDTPGFTYDGTWTGSLRDGTFLRGGNDSGAGGKFIIDVAENPQLKALASGGTAEVEIGWKGLKFNKFSCFFGWCKTRVTDAQIVVYDGQTTVYTLKGSARGSSTGKRSATVKITPNSKIVASFGIEGKGAGVDGMFIKFQDFTRPVLNDYTFIGNGEERTNDKIETGSKQELFVKVQQYRKHENKVEEQEYISLSYNFSKPVSPSRSLGENAFEKHKLFVNTPGTGLPGSGQQQYMENVTFTDATPFKEYHPSIEYKYVASKYHQSGNNPIRPELAGSNDAISPMDKTLEQKFNDAVLIDGAGNVVEINNNMNKASNASETHLKGKNVDPFDYSNPDGYRVIIDAVAPKYTKVGNGIQPEILTGVVLNENDTIDFTVQLSEEAIIRKGWNVEQTHLLFNNGMRAYYKGGEGTDKWKFSMTIKNSDKAHETPLLKVVALTHDQNNPTNPTYPPGITHDPRNEKGERTGKGTQSELETNVLRDYAGNYLIQPANYDGEFDEADFYTKSCTRVFHEYEVDKDGNHVLDEKGNPVIKKDNKGNYVEEKSDTPDKKCDPELVNSKIDWANLSIDNTPSIINHSYDQGGATDKVYQKNGRITINANDPQLMVPGLDPAPLREGDVDIRGTYRPSNGIYRPSNMTGPQSPAAGLVYYYWSQSPDNPLAGKEGDNFAAIKRYSLSAKQPGDDLYSDGVAKDIKLSVANNMTNTIDPPKDALKPNNSGDWYLHIWTADMSWDSARELMQYEKMKEYVAENPEQYNKWKEEYAEKNKDASEADKIFYADKEALKAVGDYGNLDVWPLEDFKQKDSNWVYKSAKLLLDNHGPVVTFPKLVGNDTANVTVSAQVQDIHSGFKNVQYQWVKKGLFGSGKLEENNWVDAPLTDKTTVKNSELFEVDTKRYPFLDGDGTYELYIRSTDVLGNKTEQKMEEEVTVNSTKQMTVKFLPEPSPSYVKSHDIYFQVLGGITPVKVEYAFSSSIAKPTTGYTELEVVANDTVTSNVARIVAERELESNVEDEDSLENEKSEGTKPNPESSEEDSKQDEPSPPSVDDSIENPEATASEDNEEEVGFFAAVFNNVKDFVVGLFTAEVETTNQEFYSYLIPKDETLNGPVYLHVRVADVTPNNDKDYYYFMEEYLFNNKGPGIYFSSEGVPYPLDSHEVTVTIEHPLKTEKPVPNGENGGETEGESGLDESLPESEVVQPVVGDNESETEPSNNSSNTDEQGDIGEGTEDENITVQTQSQSEVGVDSSNSTNTLEDAHPGEGTDESKAPIVTGEGTEQNADPQNDDESKGEDEENNEEFNGEEKTEAYAKYQWVKAVDGKFEPGDMWLDLPENGVVMINHEALAEDEDIAEFELFVKTSDEIGNVTEASTVSEENNQTFEVIKPIDSTTPPLASEFNLIYLFGDDQDGYTAVVEMKFPKGKEQLIRGYEYSLSPDGGKSWGKWRPYTNFASIKLPTNDGSKVQVKYRTGGGVISEEAVMLNTTTVSSEEPVYALASLNTTRPVNGETGVELTVTPPLGISVFPTDENQVQPERISGNTFKVVKNGYYSFELLDIDNPDRKSILFVVISNVDTEAPIGSVQYITPADKATNANKTVRLITNEPVTILNNDGKTIHTFEENGTFTFEFEDEAGNPGTATAIVSGIFKEAPKVKVVPIYDGHNTITDSSGKIFASAVTLEVQNVGSDNRSFTVNGKAAKTMVMKENGYATFVVRDDYGNTTIVKEFVDNIVTAGPEVTDITYTFVDESGAPIEEDKIVEIDGVQYAKGHIKATLSGSTDPMNKVFFGTTPIEVDGKYNNLVSDSEGKFTYSRNFSAEGNMSMPLTDLLGNVVRVPVAIKGLDNTAPEITLKQSSVGVEKNKKDFNFKVDLGGFTVTDNVSSPKNIKVEVTGLDLTKLGVQRVTYTVTDEVGNTSKVDQEVYVVDDAGMLIFANDVLISAAAGTTALFNENTLTFNISRYNVMNVEGKERVNTAGTYDVFYQSGLYREGQMKYIAEKVTYEELINGNFEVTFPKAGWYTLIVRNQEREREYGSFFIGNSK